MLVFMNKASLEHSRAHSFTWWLWLLFLLQRQFSSCNRDQSAYKIYDNFYLARHRRGLLSPPLSVVALSCGFPSHLRDCTFTSFPLLWPSGGGGWCSLEFCPSSSHWHTLPLSIVVPVPEHRPSQSVGKLSVSCSVFPNRPGSLRTWPMCFSYNSA